jgi:hypothetical protein
MIGLRYSVAVLLLLMLSVSCSRTETYRQYAKSLDSLNGALNQNTEALRKLDTALLQRALTRYYQNKQFILYNSKDTLTKGEADALQQFYAGGKNLELVKVNREALLLRSTLINKQLDKLRADVKHNSLDTESINTFLATETSEVQRTIQLGNTQLKLFYSSMEEFRLSLREVEQYIRSRNKGQMPTVVKDTLSL